MAEGGTSGAGTDEARVTMRVRPRIQKDKWSLYWKESMETKTDVLPELTLQISPLARVADLHQKVASELGWPHADGLERLEGFKDPWDASVFKGRKMDPSKTIESHGVTSGAVIISVRRVLIPEGWKVIEEGQDEDDFSSEEEGW